MTDENEILFLQWALPKMGYQWSGFRKPKNQVINRIQNRMHELNLSGGYHEYKTYLERHPEEWKRLEQLCYVTISKFFRDRLLWDFLRDEILPGLIDNHQNNLLEIWSAGCCNGEEPYSIAIIIKQLSNQIRKDIHVSILASDQDSEVLKRAENGIYPKGALKELTKTEIETFFKKRSAEGTSGFKICRELKNDIEFERRDIKYSLPDRIFQLVFCRNLVFTYFSKKLQNEFIHRLQQILQPDGYLVIGSIESIPDTSRLRKVNSRHSVYQFNP